MTIITKVTSQKRKGRYNIFIDNEYAFSVSEKILTQFRLLKGTELTSEKIAQIKEAEADSKATELALNYLSYQPRTIAEVKQYLKDKEISEETSESAIADLEDLGYLDDSAFAKLFIKNNLRIGKDGQNSIRNKLLRKGVDENIIEDSLFEINDEDWIKSGLRLIHSLIHQQGKLASKEIERKAKNKLLSHGFSNELIANIISELDLQNDAEEQIEALKKQGAKVYRRYRNEDSFTRQQKVKRYLYQHGFSSSEIDSFLKGELVDLSEIDEA
ncbi:recombination regulator RecX [Lactobacillus sp. PV034]|uniref:recombination regulator RecX n=1 Tax=Lactobacillus sp. PV034 TaxID=2594495 RepID=UPI0022405457|nr:recombination regulator RecX [Lactobacillus sp. PV034]QNQ80757.1 recombination regulator RecX [Lactobacillus sp. PV034]